MERCERCGDEAEVLYVENYTNVCPTDRGDEVREMSEDVCADCLHKLERRRAR